MLVQTIEAKKPFNFVAQSSTLIGLMAYNLLFQARDDFPGLATSLVRYPFNS